MQLRIFGLVVAIALLLVSCLDKIDLSVPKGTQEGLVIRGELTKGEPSAIKVFISSLFNFDLKSLGLVFVKSVSLIDENGTEMEISKRANTLFEHTFERSDPIQIEYYQSYKIKVVTEEGQTYESSYEELIPLPEGKASLGFEAAVFESLNDRGEIIERPALQFLANTSLQQVDSDENARLIWTAERTYQLTDTAEINIPTVYSKTCWLTVNLDFDNILLLDGSDFTTNEAENFPLSKVSVNHEFAEGYTYTVFRKSLNEGAFTYWKNTKQAVERQGQLFEPAVGRVQSNLQNVNDPSDNSIFGYFSVHDQDTSRLYIPPLGVERLCPITPRFGSPCPDPFPICCDCSQQAGSTVSKPVFWPN